MHVSYKFNALTSGLRLHRGAIKSPAIKSKPLISRPLTFLLLVAATLLSISHGSADQSCDSDKRPTCPASKIDLAFILDRSGSMANRIDPLSPETSSKGRGQTYNVQIEGVLRALADPTVIPRDGSVSITIVTFAESASVKVPRKQVNKAEDVCAIQSTVEALKCSDPDSPQEPCPSGGTLFSKAIELANKEIGAGFGRGSRRLLLISTDGDPDDLKAAVSAAEGFESETKLAGITPELDVILLGLIDADELKKNKSTVDQIVFPRPADDLPGKTMIIPGSVCNSPGQLDFSECDGQADEFARLTRLALRSNITPLCLTVTTDADTAPNTPNSQDGAMTLRQALEAANCRGGATTITFSRDLKGKTIRPLSPLPALTAPEIVIDGCAGGDCGVSLNCADSVTIDGSQLEAALAAENSDGILIRSNRDVVRNLKITNFRRAGVAVEPVCPSDAVGHNRIESNTLSGNRVAGVLVLDPALTMPCLFVNRASSSQMTENHNVRNTISKNAISDSATLIDLGGDGPTPNDADDADVGPNTLLNFPSFLNITKGATNLTITGQARGAAKANAKVEIFAVTASSVVSDKLIINGVTYLAEATTDNKGEFRVQVSQSSPTGIYTATVTDQEGNTSELMFDSGDTDPAAPRASITEIIDFGELNLNTTSSARQVVITNTGNAPLIINGCSISKCDSESNDNAALFNNSSCANQSTAINPGAQVIVNVTFAPLECGAARACLLVSSNAANGQQLRSTLTGRGTAQAKGEVITGDGDKSVEFGLVAATDKLGRKEARSKLFEIKNTGCAPLVLTLDSIRRRLDVEDSNRVSTNKRDVLFKLKMIKGEISTDLPVGSAIPEAIEPGDTMTFSVLFDPVVPAIAGKTCDQSSEGGLSADQLLPDRVRSRITFANAMGGKVIVDLVGDVKEVLELIDPCAPLSKEPRVLLTKSGDELTVTFYVFDPGLNIDEVMYRFLDGAGNEVPLDRPTTKIKDSFKNHFVKGQTFGIIQNFSRANKHPEVASVEVTVRDGGNNSDSGKSNSLSRARNITQSVQREGVVTFHLPALKLKPARATSASRLTTR